METKFSLVIDAELEEVIQGTEYVPPKRVLTEEIRSHLEYDLRAGGTRIVRGSN